MWGIWIKENEKKQSVCVPWPLDCSDCQKDDKIYFGCGNGYFGLAQLQYENGASEEPWRKTCPRFFFLKNGVQNIFQDVDDYERGAFGNIEEMDEARLSYLRVALAEREKWKMANNAEALNKK